MQIFTNLKSEITFTQNEQKLSSHKKNRFNKKKNYSRINRIQRDNCSEEHIYKQTHVGYAKRLVITF